MNKEQNKTEISIDEFITKDEMNLAEYPIALLSSRIPEGKKTIEYSDWITIDGKKKPLKWIVTGSDKYGLPTAEDQDFLLAIMEVWREDGFKDKVIPIKSRYSMLKKMELADNSQNYQRFILALNRLTGMYIYTENAFWDKEHKCYVAKQGFHIFEEYKLFDKHNNKDATEPLPFSYIKASEFFYDSIKKGNLKDLDMSFYLKLSKYSSADLTKKLYRFLDKKRYRNRFFSISTQKLAGKLGLAPNKKYYPSQLRRQLTPALENLKAEYFLEGYEFQKSKDGEKLTFIFKQAGNGYVDDPQISDLLERILEFTGDEHSKGYYSKLIREMGSGRIEGILAETRQADREGLINTSRARYFTDLAERYRGNKPL